MRDRRIKVMGDVRCSNLVMQKVNDTPWIQLVIGTVNRVESPLHKVVIVLRIVRNVNVRMLQPTSDNKAMSVSIMDRRRQQQQHRIETHAKSNLPSVQDQPRVDNNQGTTVERHHLRESIAESPCYSTSHNSSNPNV